MKNLKLIALSFALLVGSFSFASSTSIDTKEELRKQIITILNKADIELTTDELIAEVSFTLNENSELVIISVSSDHQILDSYIKNHLNYKKVNVDALNVGKIYKMPLRIIKP